MNRYFVLIIFLCLNSSVFGEEAEPTVFKQEGWDNITLSIEDIPSDCSLSEERVFEIAEAEALRARLNIVGIEESATGLISLNIICVEGASYSRLDYFPLSLYIQYELPLTLKLSGLLTNKLPDENDIRDVLANGFDLYLERNLK